MSNQPSTPEDWPAYFDAVAGLPPRETLVVAADRFEAEGDFLNAENAEGRAGGDAEKRKADSMNVPSPAPFPAGSPLDSSASLSSTSAFSAFGSSRFAVDLGCGDGRDTVELLRRGWRVLAIDGHPDGIARLRAKVPAAAMGRLETMVARFEDVPLPRCDLVNASFSIPHCRPADFGAMWERIVGAVRPGGRFAGQLFGVRDGWAKRPDGITRTYHSREQVEEMLEGFEVEMLDEIERPGKTAMGEPKDWHVFHIVARRKR